MTIPTQTLPEVEEEITEFDGHCHYVRIKSLMEGGVIVALCGKRYVPIHIANATDFPLCPKCEGLMAVLEQLSEI